MNEYQKQVDAIDARHRRRVKIASFVGAAILIYAALWASDFRIGPVDFAKMWAGAKEWWQQEWNPLEQDPRQAVVPQLPTPVSVGGTKNNEPPKPLPGTDSSISKTPQALVLVSTTRGRNAREGTARLGTHPENPQTYAAGAILANGARLLEIYDDYVVLERDGKQAKLFLASSGKKSDNALAMVGGEQPIKPAVITHTESLTDYIRPSPVYEGASSSPTGGGQIIHGYQVYAGQKSSVFSQLGLQNGDVILSLDGQPFVEPRQSIEMLEQLLKGTTMSAMLERRGKIEQVSLDGKVITADQERAKQVASNAPSMRSGPLP